MHCPFCQAEDTKVIDSRLVADGSQTRRRRSCEVCHARFTTFETVDLLYMTNNYKQTSGGRTDKIVHRNICTALKIL